MEGKVGGGGEKCVKVRGLLEKYVKWGRGREVCEGGEDRKKIMRKREYGGI